MQTYHTDITRQFSSLNQTLSQENAIKGLGIHQNQHDSDKKKMKILNVLHLTTC